MTEFRTWVGTGPKCFQVLGLSESLSLLQNPQSAPVTFDFDFEIWFLPWASGRPLRAVSRMRAWAARVGGHRRGSSSQGPRRYCDSSESE
jgi:hypothetical protein